MASTIIIVIKFARPWSTGLFTPSTSKILNGINIPIANTLKIIVQIRRFCNSNNLIMTIGSICIVNYALLLLFFNVMPYKISHFCIIFKSLLTSLTGIHLYSFVFFHVKIVIISYLAKVRSWFAIRSANITVNQFL